MKGLGITQKFIQEWREFVFLTIYLTLFLSSLSIYKSLILDDNIFSFFRIGYIIVEALVLAKIILLGKMLHLGTHFDKDPLIIPVIYKSAVFSLFVLLFTSLEHSVSEFFKGKGFVWAWPHFSESLGKLLIAFIVFILLFSFLEVARVFGETKVFELFFKKRDKDA